MKRVIICAVLMAGAICLSLYSYNKVLYVERGVTARIDALEKALESGDGEMLAERAAELESFWDREEEYLIHFVRHSSLDDITMGVARLPRLARHGDFAEFDAETANIRRQIAHIRDNERLTFINLF